MSRHKRDEAIRKRIEADLNKRRRNGSSLPLKHKRGKPGTVLSLKPSPPIICKPSTTVFEVSQIMAAKRENCILVVEEGQLLGIFTAKDLAFRIVGSGLHPNNVSLDKIMTPNPFCVESDALASDALMLMVERGFRHLPIRDQQDIIGVLDITKCYEQQMEKLEKLHQSTKKLYEALDSVNSQIGNVQQPYQILEYFEHLKDKMNGPLLQDLMDEDSSLTPIYCNIRTTVYDATVLMKANNTTAVLVKDNDDKVNGIFTSKDVVLRVIATGLDPKNCSIIRVMTPKPDLAPKSLTIQQALRKMFDGHYLNLPIVDEDSEIIGIVDVLKLTYSTLNQIKLVDDNEGQGPAWNKFWTSLDDTDSLSSITNPDHSDIHPSDSISHVGLEVDSRSHIGSGTGPSQFETSPSHIESTDLFVFKFNSPGFNHRVHRVSLKPGDGINELRQLIDHKLHPKDFHSLKIAPPSESSEDSDKYAISYVDDENDIVSITSDSDLVDCFKIWKSLRKADLYLHNPHDPAPTSPRGRKPPTDILPGVPNEILIPGLIMVLATSLIIGFTYRRR